MRISSAALAMLFIAPTALPQSAKTPFYTHKSNLLVYLDSSEKAVPIKTPV